ncbi:MAG: hypothetical protein RR146_09465 [Lachnospiraceae bacterium]
METTNLNPAKGLQTIRKANIWAIIAVVLAAIGGIIIAVAQSMSGNWAQYLEQLKNTNNIAMLAIISCGAIISMVSVVLILIARVRELIALIKLSKIHTGYKTALILILSSLVLSGVVTLLLNGAIGKAALQALNLCFIASVYFIIGATVEFLRNHGNDELATKGLRVCKLYVGCNVVAVAAGLLALLPALTVVAGIVTLVTAVLQFVALLKYIGFLGHAVTALES